MFTALFTFPNEFKMMLKERASGMYRLSAFYIARTASDLPMVRHMGGDSHGRVAEAWLPWVAEGVAATACLLEGGPGERPAACALLLRDWPFPPQDCTVPSIFIIMMYL